MRLSLQCLSGDAEWAMPAEKKLDVQFGMVIRGAPLRLRASGPDGEDHFLHLVASQLLTPYFDDRGREYRCRTDKYTYSVFDDQQNEVASWHWHPETYRSPHVHVREARGLHIPTGRVTFESVVRFLIEDLGVQEARQDWDSVLNDQEDRHLTWRTWS